MSPATPAEVDGTPVWQTNETLKYKIRSGAAPLTDHPLYVKITYLDDAPGGKLQVAYRTVGGAWIATDAHTRSSRVGTEKFVESYHALDHPEYLTSDGLLRVRILEPDGTPLSVKSIEVSEHPFDNPAFRKALAAPWKEAPRFPPDTSAPKTLKGKIMVGYQGWFRTPNDFADIGWRHWLRLPTRTKPISYAIDMWPDVTAYPKSARFSVPGLKTQKGDQAYLFSSTSPEVIAQHFKWMREYNIDGVFLQRFLSDRMGGDDGNTEWVLHYLRQSANKEKRLWAIEYDVSGLKNDNTLSVLTKDWAWLVDVLKVTSDPYYARENGRPVVFVWGLPVEGRGFKPEVANTVVDFFKNDPQYGGNYVIGGIPGQWRKLDAGWQEHIRKYDGVLTWQGRRYQEDRQDFEKMKITYYPHVWPGFSWSNLKDVANQYTPRYGGKHYWELIDEAVKAGNDRLFVGMFDEYDEGTAIIPMSDDAPLPEPSYGRFLTNEGKPAMWWLTLTSCAKEMLEGKRRAGSPMP